MHTLRSISKQSGESVESVRETIIQLVCSFLSLRCYLVNQEG